SGLCPLRAWQPPAPRGRRATHGLLARRASLGWHGCWNDLLHWGCAHQWMGHALLDRPRCSTDRSIGVRCLQPASHWIWMVGEPFVSWGADDRRPVGGTRANGANAARDLVVRPVCDCSFLGSGDRFRDGPILSRAADLCQRAGLSLAEL